MIYVVLAALAILAAAFVAAPLARAAPGEGDRRAALFRRQIAEIDRDAATGLIAAEEAQALRREAQRRLIAQADAPPLAPSRARRGAAALLAALALAVAGGIYALRGAPQMPAASPIAGEPTADDIAQRLAAHLTLHPGDGAALSAYGEALAFAADGLVTAEARSAFARALSIDSADVRALFFLGLERDQAGDAAGAVGYWKPLAARAPADAPWASGLRARLAELEGVAAMAAMSDADRTAMIEGMVSRLAARLAASPDDPEGWARLVKSYAVLGRAEQAQAAVDEARSALAGEQLATFEAALAAQ